MKKLFAILVVVLLLWEFLAFPSVKAISTDAPVPTGYCAYSMGQTVYIKWNYSCPSGFTCYIEIYENLLGIWDNIATISASASPKSFLGQSYGKHEYKLRAKLVYYVSGFPITMYSSNTPIFYAYVLNKPTGLTVSVNPDVLFTEGNSYLTLKWNTVDSNATYVQIWRRVQGVDIYDLRATLPSSVTTLNDTTVLSNLTYEYVIDATRKDDTLIHDDYSLSIAMVSKLSLPAAPTNFQANGIDKTVYMAWSHTKNCDGYKIYKWAKSGMLFYWSLVATLNKNTFSYNTPVADYGAYSFKVTAYNASGDSPKSPTKDAYALKTPTGLTAIPLSSTSIKLTWDQIDTNATQVRVSYSTNEMFYSSLGAFNLPVSYVTVSSLTPNTQYWFKIAAKRDSNESNYSNFATAKTLPVGTPPYKPSGFGGVALSCNKVDLTWIDGSNNEDGFKIERKEGVGAYSEIGNTLANATSYSDTTILLGKTYYYRVRAYNSYGNSDYTVEINITIPACGSDIYSTGMITVGGTMTCDLDLGKEMGSLDPPIDFFWNQVTSVERYIEPKNGAMFHVVESVDFDSITHSSLKTYSYSSDKINGSNDSSNQMPVGTVIAAITDGGRYSKFKIEVYGYDLVIKFVTYKENSPNAPSNLTATATSCTNVNLAWTDNADNETGFKIERKESGGTYTEIATVTANTTTYSDTTAVAQKAYYYRVIAYNSFGNSSYTNEANVTTPACGSAPNKPTNLTASANSPIGINITWTDNSDNEDGFKMERKELGGTYTEIKTLAVNVTSYSDTGLNPDTTYYYRIRAYNSFGHSDYSNEANTTTKPAGTAPSKPSNLTGIANSTSEISLTWTDNSGNEDGFKLERKAEGGSYTEIKTLSSNATSFTDSSVSPDKTYTYRVRSFNSIGYSDYSNEVSVKTPSEVETIEIKLYIDKTIYYVNGVKKELDAAPIIKESRTLLPIRAVIEALGGTIEWDANEQKVTINFKGTTIELWIGKNTALVNGEYKLIDPGNPEVKPIIIPPGRTMLPIRFIAENLGCRVDWDPALKEVKITYPAL
jgi:titin